MTSNLEKFKDRLKNIEQNRLKKKPEPKGLGIGMKIGLDLISPIVVGILIGLGFDKIFSTKPIFFLIFLPSEIFLIKTVSLPINLKAALQNSNPAIIPSCLAMILALIILFFEFIRLVVMSPLGLKSSSRAFFTTVLI